MTDFAPTLQSWFTEFLIGQRRCEPQHHRGLPRLHAPTPALCPPAPWRPTSPTRSRPPRRSNHRRVLGNARAQRHASVATRNARLAAIHSMFSYASFRHPEHAELIARVLAIPSKTACRTVVVYLDDSEVDAVLAAPDRRTWSGQRDHAWLLLMITTGIRVGELVGLCRLDCRRGDPLTSSSPARGASRGSSPSTGPSRPPLPIGLGPTPHHPRRRCSPPGDAAGR